MPFKQLIDENKVRVVFSKPFFDEVSVELLGDFNDWRRGTTPLSRSADGEWLTTLDLERDSSFRYVYLVNDYIWHSDPEGEDFVEGPFGEEASMISTAVNQVFPERLGESDLIQLSVDTAVCKKILLPFDSYALLNSVFDVAIEKAQHTNAELVLLRLRRDNKRNQGRFGQESTFSKLRGLQIQVQQLSCKVSVDTAVGVNANTISSYAQSHEIDLIVIADNQIQPQNDGNMAEILTETAVCPTEIIRPN